jgi:single-stranded-DNA-specific exonuclease
MTQRWTIRDVDTAASQMLADTCGLTPLVARTLVARNIRTIDAAEVFLHPCLERDWSDPARIPGMVAVADALEKAIRAGRRILVFGDFDVDGISATACMIRGLAALGVNAAHLIPNRIDEGYGLTAGALERAYEYNPELVVTVDCGISAHDEVAQMRARGIEVLVTDHHEPSEAVSTNVPVADPKLEKDSPQSILAGVGVALKLIALLGERLGRPQLWRDLVDLATLGTLADVMPLTGENRSLVAEGLALIERAPRPGIAAALALSRRDARVLTASELSFGLIPRLNAAGRMGDAHTALELLVDDDPARSFETAAALDAANRERRATESVLLAEARAQAEPLSHGQKVVVVAGEGWHEGVRGIVASRLASRYGLPTIVFTLTDDEARGSGRSVGAVNLFRALERCAEYTLRFGGHEAAVGVTVARDALEDFCARLEDVMAQEPGENFDSPLLVDAQVTLADLDVEAVEQLALLEPCGQDNREPLYVTRNLTLRNARAVGQQKNHLSFTATDGRDSLSGIWFQCPAIEEFLAWKGTVDVVYRPRVDEWNGARRVQLTVERIYRAGDDGSDEDRRFALAADGADAIPPAGGTGGAAVAPPEPPEPPAAMAPREPPAAAATPEPPADGTPSAPTEGLRALWERRAGEPTADLTQQLASEIIGAPARLHQVQAEALVALEAGTSILTVMATGRGKSLIFQTYAARLALSERRASVFIYPLRALIADQLAHLNESFARLGLTVCSLTGENTADEKDALFQRLYEGTVDVLLTTPEFFALHVWRFAASERVGFVVFDEAHHIHTERTAEREGYHDLGALRLPERFSSARFLAVTATSDDRITSGICRALGIRDVIVDDARRPNLRVDDARDLRDPDRERFLVSIVERGEKTVIYANSRVQAITLARLLRKRLPAAAPATVFYHAGLSRAERRAIERGFRAGEFRVIISTSAFGEGVNIPDVAHVVLYHLPFSAVAFNQMSGRAGRDGQAATVHLLYTAADATLNRRLLAPSSPGRKELVALYRVLREHCRMEGAASGAAAASPQAASASASAAASPQAASASAASAGPQAPTPASFVASLEDLVAAGRRHDPHTALDERGVFVGLAIFEELGLIKRDEGFLPPRITLVADKRVELSASSRYLEGMEELAVFERFRTWALGAAPDELREQISGPLTPSGDGQVSVHER